MAMVRFFSFAAVVAFLIAACATPPSGSATAADLEAPPPILATMEASRWTTLDGWRIHYWDWGPADASKVILFIHGWANSGIEALPVAEVLTADASGGAYRVIAVDLPGCGFSDRPAKPIDMKAYGRFVADWVSLVNRKIAPGKERQRVLWGHSLGGHMALTSLADWRFAPATGKAPPPPRKDRLRKLALSRIDRLVLSSPAGLRGEAGGPAGLGGKELAPTFSALYTDSVYDWLAGSMIYADLANTPGVVHDIEKLALRWNNGINSLAFITGDVLGSQPVDDLLAGIKLPVLLTWGSADKLLPPRWADEFARQLPDVTLAMINRGAHGVHLEQPDRLATLIREFCQPFPVILTAR